MKLKRTLLAASCAIITLTTQASTMPEPPAPVSVFESRVYRDLFSTEDMRSIFSDETLVNRWVEVEVALAKSQADLDIIPESAYHSIKKTADNFEVDFDALRAGTNKVGRGIKPLLDQLKASGDEQVSSYLHFGSTTQDIMDTATVLQVKAANEVIRKQLVAVALQLADLAEEHKTTVMIARSNGQDAIPTTLGLHLTTYMMELNRHIQRLDEASARLQPQIGGTVGTLSAYGDKGLDLQEGVAKELGLTPQTGPWNPSRDNFAETVQILGLVNATLGRVAIDINNYSRTQINEIQEGEGGASSTMPQKRNPRASEYMGAFARMGKMYNSAALDIMSHSDTRQGAPWIVEWSILPESFMVTSAALQRASGLFDKLIVNEDKMLENFSDSKNYVMSEALMNKLAAKVGRGKAYSLVKHAIRSSSDSHGLKDIIENTPEIKQLLTEQEIQAVLDPANYIGSSEQLVENAVAEVRKSLL
ncbi:class-II fumarase/aspartase family protein [Endozoicomonas arenosclerae]|uniref:class-II fumarase/aspartase family protein n=1 Tax=Endozoicomonas arenosclerae TaxID=1633495 RepID=UPI0007846B96|nr:adenylosuccinate lyase family protein [Endozoicomonas arenosclerae]